MKNEQSINRKEVKAFVDFFIEEARRIVHLAESTLHFSCFPDTEIYCDDYFEKQVDELISQAYNESVPSPVTSSFHKLTKDEQQAILDYLGEFTVYEEVEAGGNTYLLIHGGLDHYEPGKEIEDYTLQDIVWSRADYDIRYFPDKLVVTGHTPTQYIENNPRPGHIFRKNGHIAIDCGCNHRNGRLAALCLDTGEEFYSSDNKENDYE